MNIQKIKKPLIGLGALAISGLFTACNDSEFAAEPGATLGRSSGSGTDNNNNILTNGGGATNSSSDSFNIPNSGQNKLDILFCVDNSGSMANEQQILADSFSQFISGFQSNGIDTHYGIVSSDVTAMGTYWSSTTGVYGSYVNAGPGRLLSRYAGESYLTSSSSSLVDKFKANVQLGTAGSGYEQCLQSFYLALDSNMLSTYNAGFLRDDAHLALVVVSDEDEAHSANETHSAVISRVEQRVRSVKVNSQNIIFSYIINKSVAAPAVEPTYPSGSLSYPLVYLQAAGSDMRGDTFDIANNFGSNLIQLGSNLTTAAQRQFQLSQVPSDLSKVVVKLNGAVVAQDANNGWSYVSSNNAIQLNGTAFAQSPGGTLLVTY